ncbi:MAG: ParA family protein [Hungatella sp.]|nr:ParA family protein [Hungatella sp.]
MRTISIINLKGGCAKTLSSVNIAHILSAVHKRKVLLIDNDKQGDASKLLNRHGYTRPGVEEILTDRGIDMTAVIQSTDYEGLDIVTANMNLLTATLEVMLDQKRPQHNRFKKALEQVRGKYDFCIIDNAPDINISTINALTASDDVLVPVTIDDFAIDGLKELVEQINNTREDLNPNLRFCGCFITQFDRANEADKQGEVYLKGLEAYPLFETHIRRTLKMKPSTFVRKPILEYSCRCGAARDYKALVEEYLNMCPSGTQSIGKEI